MTWVSATSDEGEGDISLALNSVELLEQPAKSMPNKANVASLKKRKAFLTTLILCLLLVADVIVQIV